MIKKKKAVSQGCGKIKALDRKSELQRIALKSGAPLAWLGAVASSKADGLVMESSLLGLITDGVLIVDVETDGFFPHLGNRPFLIGLASSSGRTAIVEMDDEERMAKVRRLLSEPRLTKVGHNWKFDHKMIRAAGVKILGPCVDTMMLTQLADSRIKSYALKRLAANLLGEDTGEEDKVKDWIKKENRRRRSVARKYDLEFEETTYADVPRKLMRPYLEKDLEYTAKLLFTVGPRVSRLCPGAAKAEMRLLKVVAAMEERGVKVDGAYFTRMSAQADKELTGLEKKAHKLAETTFDLQSGKQLGNVLLNKLGLECMGWTPKGNPKFDADTLPLYDHPVARVVLAYRKKRKLRSTYYENLADLAARGGNLIHPSFRQIGAITGRFSCANPNLQNVPRMDKTVRAGFVCRPGFVNYYLDYSQIEMRIFAHYASAKELIEALRAGADTHEKTSVLLFGEEARGNEQLRFVGKTINFGIIYGMGAPALRKQLRKRLLDELEHADTKPSQTVLDLANITDGGSRSLLQKYYRVYPDVRPFMDQIQHELYRKGHITDVYGRVYQVPVREAYKAVNYLVQGTAAGVLKRAMLKISKVLRTDERLRSPKGRRCWMVNCVHDEVQIEVPKAIDNVKTAKRLVKVMEDRDTFKLPITMDVSISRTNWAEKKEIEL